MIVIHVQNFVNLRAPHSGPIHRVLVYKSMAPLFSCAHSIVKLRAMVIHVPQTYILERNSMQNSVLKYVTLCHVRVYARRLTIHIHFTQAQPCRNYRYMPRSWPYTELRNGKKRGIDQSETSSHLTHLIYKYMHQRHYDPSRIGDFVVRARNVRGRTSSFAPPPPLPMKILDPLLLNMVNVY